MKGAILRSAAILCTMAMCSLHLANAAEPAAKVYAAKLVVSEMKDGQMVVVSEPTLMTTEATEASFLNGGQVRVNGTTEDWLPFGQSTRVKIFEIAPDQLRVWLYVSQGDL